MNLSPREEQVLRCAEEGMTILQTALFLNLSVPTVEQYRGSAMKSLDAHNITEAVAIRLKNMEIKELKTEGEQVTIELYENEGK